MSKQKSSIRSAVEHEDPVSVRMGDACKERLTALKERLGCSRSNAIRYAIMNAERLFKSDAIIASKVESSFSSIEAHLDKLDTLNHEALRVPSFYEYRVRAMVEDWEEVSGMSPNDVRAIILVGKRYAMQYGKIPDPADKKRFGATPENFNATEFLKRVATLVNAAHIRGYGE